MSSQHTFALYVSDVSSRIRASKEITLDDVAIVHRIRSVLRLSIGEKLILFDGKQQASSILAQVTKKSVVMHVVKSTPIVPLHPVITVLLPVLKREALERMVYACVELGATTIQFVHTEKSQRLASSGKEQQRMHALMVAAAEQSKQLAFPNIIMPCSLQEALHVHKDIKVKIVADSSGMPLYEVLTQIRDKKENTIVITLGPEGDFTDAEKALLHAASYQSVCLTPTVLRAQQAGALLLGVIRSIV